MSKKQSIARSNILICGLNNTGSSAVLDMLMEYENIGLLPGEFDEFRRPGMVADHLIGRIPYDYPSKLSDFDISKKHLNLPKKPLSLKLKVFIKKLITNSSLRNYALKKLKKERAKALQKLEPLLLQNSSFDKKLLHTRQWLDDLKRIYAPGKEYFIFDQALLLPDHSDVWPKVFDPFKLIIVYRDPRDQLANMIKRNHLFLQFNARMLYFYQEGGRKGAMRMELDVLKRNFDLIRNIQVKHGTEKVMMISFDKFVQNYEDIKSSIEEFIGLSAKQHIEKGKYFLPERSKQNIGLYNKYLRTEELPLFEETMAIYRELEDNNPFYR